MFAKLHPIIEDLTIQSMSTELKIAHGSKQPLLLCIVKL